MSAAQDIHQAVSAGPKAPPRLAVARHARGFDAIGWVLLGFVLGAGAAIAVLLNADFPRRAATPEASHIMASGPVLRLQLDQAPRQAAAAVAPPAPAVASAAPAAIPPLLATAARPATAPSPAAPATAKAPRKGAATAEPMADDAAAAGMTSRSEGGDSGLY